MVLSHAAYAATPPNLPSLPLHHDNTSSLMMQQHQSSHGAAYPHHHAFYDVPAAVSHQQSQQQQQEHHRQTTALMAAARQQQHQAAVTGSPFFNYCSPNDAAAFKRDWPHTPMTPYSPNALHHYSPAPPSASTGAAAPWLSSINAATAVTPPAQQPSSSANTASSVPFEHYRNGTPAYSHAATTLFQTPTTTVSLSNGVQANGQDGSKRDGNTPAEVSQKRRSSFDSAASSSANSSSETMSLGSEPPYRALGAAGPYAGGGVVQNNVTPHAGGGNLIDWTANLGLYNSLAAQQAAAAVAAQQQNVYGAAFGFGAAAQHHAGAGAATGPADYAWMRGIHQQHQQQQQHRHEAAPGTGQRIQLSGPGTNNVRVRTREKYRMVYSDYQRLELEKEFHYNKYITTNRKTDLSQHLALTERQIKIWFQNRRAKERRQSRKEHFCSNGGAANDDVTGGRPLVNSASPDDGDERHSLSRDSTVEMDDLARIGVAESLKDDTVVKSDHHAMLSSLAAANELRQQQQQQHFLQRFTANPSSAVPPQQHSPMVGGMAPPPYIATSTTIGQQQTPGGGFVPTVPTELAYPFLHSSVNNNTINGGSEPSIRQHHDKHAASRVVENAAFAAAAYGSPAATLHLGGMKA